MRGDERSYALARSITEEQAALWRASLPEEWANESHGIAAAVIYNRLTEALGILSSSYETDMLPIVNEQLQRAGVRLAAVLNVALTSR